MIPFRAAALTLWLVTLIAAPAAAQPAGPTRLFVGPTGRSLAPGHGYFVLSGGLVPGFQVGVTNRVSVGAGTFFLVGGSFWITPKVQLLRHGAETVSATLVHVVIPGEGAAGLVFGSNTHETERGGVTIGVGAVYTRGWNGGPMFMVGADRQISPRVTVLSETYIVTGGFVTSINGIRASWTHFSLDLGAAVMVAGGVRGGPTLNLSWRF